ncbi:HNH endonuclease [Methylobacterium sp. NEAU 140]|uniref:HNH endonuclease n=1 Tax=Methylobacterium sp. NEAU 140 TaxID=3064945 RepID=UPI0027371F96|nr:HNH endonuclease [Methylobacterium sp. NEAU 140]MDP4024447.1 HNH endonuclease [Methylobacterium sp. NEAU 140]
MKLDPRRQYDERRRRDQPWRRLYHLARWRRIRAGQLKRQPLCERCLGNGVITPATVCHHVVPHRGDEALFWAGPFASSCADCHDIDEGRIERGGQARQTLDADGWPITG